MMKLLVFTCLLGFALSAELYATSYYAPNLAYYAPGVTLARTAAALPLPLAYARLHAQPSTELHSYNSVQTPNSFQQQYRADYKPLTYQYLL